MRLLVIALATVVIVMQCHSFTFRNAKDAERENAACMGSHRSARVHRDAKQNASSLTRIDSVVTRNSLNLTSEEISLSISEQLKNLITLYEENLADKTIRGTLFDIQRQLVQICKYLDKLCKKHHSTSTITPEVNLDKSTTSINQTNDSSIIKN